MARFVRLPLKEIGSEIWVNPDLVASLQEWGRHSGRDITVVDLCGGRSAEVVGTVKETIAALKGR